MRYKTIVDGEEYDIQINREDELILNGLVSDVDFVEIGGQGLHSLLIDNESFEALVEERDGRWYVLLRGHMYVVDVADERTARLAARAGLDSGGSGEANVSAPMPGLVVKVTVEVGQTVEAGDTVVILESMKMENELKANRSGTVERITVEAGQSVEQGQILIAID